MSGKYAGVAAEPTWRRVAHLMGMPVSVALRGRHAGDSAGQAAWEAVVAELAQVDRVFSTYRPDSVISRHGRGELPLGECPPEVAEVLGLAEAARLVSGGAFDVRRPAGDRPTPLDTDGVVKGWAVQRVSALLARLDGTDSCLSAGGDMVCRVVRPGAPAWRIGIEDPLRPSRIVARVPAHRGRHIVDGRTGFPAADLASVTVVAADLTWADLDATAAFAMGADGVGWLRSRGRCGVVVWSDGRAEVYSPAA